MSSVGKPASRKSSSKYIMPGRTRTRPISMRFRRDTPARILLEIRKRYASYLDEPEVLEEWQGSELERKISSSLKPGDWLRHLREAHGLTQEELGHDLGGVSGSRISDWESHRRSVSKAMAKKLSNIFNVSPERFI